jgi:dTDP-4-dehydrorhamnose reductase
VSTDYVFDGTLTGRPYVESDPTAPIGAYGRTKRAGEEAVIGHNPDHAIARTAWLFGAGGKSFPDTMLKLAADRDAVAVVTDQVGSPTWTGHLSPALLDLAAAQATGIFHTAGGGQCSWHELTVELYRAAGVACAVTETTAAEFRRPAPRPAWSVLATERDETPRLPPWQEGLAGFLSERNAT